MTYRHIYYDELDCIACGCHTTEPNADGTGRKCHGCGRSRPNAFDPDRDPFNPEREEWTGWKNSKPDYWTTPDVIVDNRIGTVIEIFQGARRVCYCYGKQLPHRTVVSILVSNGYVPEVGV